MRSVNVSDVIGKSKLNAFYLASFLVLLLTMIIDGSELAVYGTSLPVLIESTGISPTVFGLIGTFAQYAMMLGGLIFGMSSDKFGRKITLIICVLFYSIGTGMFGLSNSPVEFAIWRMVAGMGLAGVAPICVALVSEYSPIKNRVTLITLITVGPPMGGIIAPLLGLIFLPSGSWRALYLIGFIPIVMIIFIIKYVPESMERLIKGDKRIVGNILKKANPDFDPSPNDEYVSNTSEKPKKAALAALFKDGMLRNTILFWVAFICVTFSLTSINTWLPKLMTGQGYPLYNSLMFTLIFALGAMPAIAFAGWVVNRLGYKKAIITYLGITTVLVLLMLVKAGVVILFVILFFSGGGLYGAFGLIYSYTAGNYPIAYRGTGIGWAGSMGRFGASFGPIIGGLLIAADPSTANQFMFLIIACLLVVAAASIIYIRDITEGMNAN